MNRDPARILFIDDNPDAVQLCPKNALIVKPFTDVYDTKDRVLLDLIPLLQVSEAVAVCVLLRIEIQSLARSSYLILLACVSCMCIF